MTMPEESITGEGKTNYFRETMVALLTSLLERSVALQKLSHGPTVGETREALLRELISALLPARYGLVSGVLSDVLGNQSAQFDAVIVDHSVVPPFMLHGESSVIPVEAAVIAFEFKTVVKSETLDQIRSQVASLLQLATQLTGEHRVPLSLLALDSALSVETVAASMGQIPNLVSACVLSKWAILARVTGPQIILTRAESKHLPDLAYLSMTVGALDAICATRRIEAPSSLWQTYLIGPDMWNGRYVDRSTYPVGKAHPPEVAREVKP